MMKIRVCLAGLTVLSVSVVWAHSMSMNKVGFRETGGVHVESGTEVQSEDVILDSTAKFYKTGEGTLELPLSKVNAQVPYGMAVLGGTLRITEGADATVDAEVPPAICQQAAYWVDPDSAVVTGETYVARWCDVREPDATRTLDAATAYPHADPAWFHPLAGNDGVPPEVRTDYGRTSVYFGGFHAGRYLQWDRVVDNIQSVFIVHGCIDTLGALVGYSVRSRMGGLSPSTQDKQRKDLTAHFSTRGDLAPDTFSMAAFLDGVPLDVTTTPPKKGFQLLECVYAPIVTRADTFCLTRLETQWNANENYHQGGDYIAEALVFTNMLTEASRLEIERYLLKKWNLPVGTFDQETGDGKNLILPKPVGTVGIAAGATAEVDVSSGSETAPLAFNGEGDLVKKGEGTLVIGQDDSGKPASGSLTLEAGAVIARQGGRLPPLRIEGGNRYTATAKCPSGGTSVENSAASGLELVRSDESDETVAVKAGDGWARANAVDPGVKRLCVEAGVLQLEAKPVETAYVPSGVVTGIVRNADFEEPYEVDSQGKSPSMNWAFVNGWASSGWAYQYYRGGWAWNAYGINDHNFGPADGNSVFFGAEPGRFTGEITLPVAGAYELTFLARARYGTVLGSSSVRNSFQRFNVAFGTGLYDNPGASATFASFTVSDGPMQRVRIRLPYREAGSTYIMFLSDGTSASGADAGIALDDLRLTLVGENEEAPAFVIPHGDAEFQPRFEGDPYRYSLFHGENLVDGWTLTDASDEPLTGAYPLVGAVSLAVFLDTSGFRSTPMFNYWDRPVGTGALTFFGSGGKATTSFAAPAGTFRLRAGLSRGSFWRSSGDYGTGTIAAKLVLANGTEIPLGSVTATAHLMSNALWPNVFTIPEAQDVTLVLNQTNSGFVIADNFVFVKDDADTYGELLADTGFDRTDKDYWKRPDTNAAKVPYTTAPIVAFGWTALSGSTVARFTGPKACYHQPVSFPAKGLYRLRVHARPRISGDQWSFNPLHFTLTPDGSATANEIGRIDPMPLYRQFQRFEYVFRVDEPGTYEFTIETVDHSDTDVYAKDRQSFVDDVSIVRLKETPGTFALPADATLEVKAGAELRLDFTNTVSVARVRLGGHYVYGTVDASTHPDFVTGLGSIEVTGTPPGALIIVR